MGKHRTCIITVRNQSRSTPPLEGAPGVGGGAPGVAAASRPAALTRAVSRLSSTASRTRYLSASSTWTVGSLRGGGTKETRAQQAGAFHRYEGPRVLAHVTCSAERVISYCERGWRAHAGKSACRHRM